MLKAPLLFLGHTFLVIQNRPNNGICPIKKVNNAICPINVLLSNILYAPKLAKLGFLNLGPILSSKVRQ